MAIMVVGIMPEDAFDLSVFDITIIELLANGVLQKDMPKFLHSKNLQRSGLSSIKKRLTLMREKFSLKSNAKLVAFLKDIGVI